MAANNAPVHALSQRCEYWRLKGADGRPPGVMGWWPSRAVTFLENHDTVCSQTPCMTYCYTASRTDMLALVASAMPWGMGSACT